MQINVVFDQSESSLPTGFVSAVDYVVNYFDSLFTNNVSMTLDVGYGEIDGQKLQAGAASESFTPTDLGLSYGAVVSALQAENAPGASTLPSTPPFSGTLYMPPDEAQALGLAPLSTVTTEYVGFSSSLSFSYTPNETPPSGEYYFIGLAEHEITEDMGRVSFLNLQPYEYSVMDLYRYSSAGVRDLTTGASTKAYFSINDGTTDLGNWNNVPSAGDLGDWLGSTNAFDATATAGVILPMSADDLILLEALGWTESSSTTSSIIVTSANSPYSISSGVIDGGVIVTSGGSMFVLSGGTGDAITVSTGGY